MSFVSLGDAGARPTFFEMVAAERLMPSLKAAVLYSLSVYAQRRPGLHRLLQHEDELFFLISVLLDRQALRSGASSFAESLYGLQRSALPAGGSGSSSSGGKVLPLSRQQQQMSLVLLTLIPYLRAKLDAAYAACQQQQQHQRSQQAGWASSSSRAAQQPGAPVAAGQRGWQAVLQRLQQQARRLALRAFLLGYPWVHAAHEGARFAYQLLYLLDACPYYSPGLHLLRLVVVRMPAAAQAEAERARQRRRAERLSRIGGAEAGAPLALCTLRMLRMGWARAGHLLEDHTRSALILAVFGFKLLEWWYTSAEQQLGEQKALPPPPPPPAPKPAPDGVPLPADPACCPLCQQRRNNPALVPTSGFVYCYACIHRHLTGVGPYCPVTRLPAAVEQLRRLYQAG